MKKQILRVALALALSAGAATVQAAPRIDSAVYHPGEVMLEKAQYVYLGHDWCWYDSAWRGPGFYWCGYGWRRGWGWGGPAGWRGWYGPGYWRHGGWIGPRGYNHREWGGWRGEHDFHGGRR